MACTSDDPNKYPNKYPEIVSVKHLFQHSGSKHEFSAGKRFPKSIGKIFKRNSALKTSRTETANHKMELKKKRGCYLIATCPRIIIT